MLLSSAWHAVGVTNTASLYGAGTVLNGGMFTWLASDTNPSQASVLAAVVTGASTVLVAVVGYFATTRRRDRPRVGEHELGAIRRELVECRKENESLRRMLYLAGIDPETGKPFTREDDRARGG